MAGTPDGPPPGFGMAGQQQQMAGNYLGQLGQALGGQGIDVAQWNAYATVQQVPPQMYYIRPNGLQGFSPAMSDAEFAEEYYDQCFGTSRTPQQRAYELLMEHLTEHERNEWWDTGRITVQTNGRRYWISGTDCGRYDDGHTFCVYIGMNECPAEDRVLGLKLLLETNESQFLKTAVDRGATREHDAEWAAIMRAAMQGGNIDGILGQYQGVQLIPNQRIPWNVRATMRQRSLMWGRETFRRILDAIT